MEVKEAKEAKEIEEVAEKGRRVGAAAKANGMDRLSTRKGSKELARK
jgi:hypothetical protein